MPTLIAMSTGVSFADISGGLTNAISLMGQVVSTIVANPFLLVYIAPSLFGIGVAIFCMIKRAAKR